MESTPDNPMDKAASEDIEVKRFGFFIEDYATIQEMIAGIRRILIRKSITAQQICGLGKLLFGLERLPRPTTGIDITITIANKTSNHSSYESISLSESFFEIWSGRSEYTPDIGSENYTNFSFSVDRRLQKQYLDRGCL